MMVPDPMCPTCQSEFVEKIEEDNDPRTFAETHEHGDEEGDEAREPVSLEDLFHLFHALNAPGMPQQQRQQGQEQQELSGSSLGLPFFFDTGMSRFGTGSEPTDLQTQNQAQTESTAGAGASGVGGAGVDGEDVEMTDATQDQETRPSRVPSVSLAALLESMVQLQYGIQGAQNGFGGLGRLFNMVGNPGDYVFGQGGLDDVITQMMELQSRQNGPVGASDEVINSIPIHKLTEEELDAKTECSVCKDEFNSQDVSLQLGCNHIFHEDCIKPWLKTNGSCPTCRFSLWAVYASQRTG
ncbi:hypothetical protein BGX28_001392 [Mortierella sp. GBA30]|nr:hypothetical protein BGX28_001392 [Mortierella sp. GBA30]